MLLEVSVFNLRHWTTRFIDPTVNALEHGGFRVNRFTPERDILQPPWSAIPQELAISNINHPVRTVFIRPDFDDFDIKSVYVNIHYQDENRVTVHRALIINGYTPSYYIPLGAMGNVADMTITVSDWRLHIQEVYFNRPLPWSFQWIRVLLLTFIVSLIWLWKKFGFSKIPFSPQHKWQRYVNAGVVAVYVGLLFFVMVFSVDFGFIPSSGNELEWTPHVETPTPMHILMVDALVMRQLHLDITPHESLLNATQPHVPTYRFANQVIAPWDHVFFNGRIYSYFGIVPTVILFLPYYLIRGAHLSTFVATFIFTAIGAVGIYFFWKELVKKYLKDIPYTMFLAGLVAALFGTNFMLIAVRGVQFEVLISSGTMFSIWGLYFILRAVKDDSFEKIKTRFLFFGGICLALAVGCRPTMILSSFMVPVLLFPFIRSCLKKVLGSPVARKTLGINFLALATPYIMIGAALAWYNFARFGSIFEFGASYQLTNENVAVVTHTGLLGNLRRAFDGIFVFLLANFDLRPTFPFVYASYAPLVFTGFMTRTSSIGALALPITWFLPITFLIRKKNSARKAMPVIIGMVTTGVLIAILSTVLIGALSRYTVDFFWLLTLPSMLCMGLAYKEACKLGDGAATIVRRLAFAAVAASCFILFGWGMVGESNYIWVNNPVVIRFLSDMFIIF